MSGFQLHAPDAARTTSSCRPHVQVAVVMLRERIDNRWQPWRWQLADIVPHQDSFGSGPRLLIQDEQQERWLHPGFVVELFTDDADGYHLNTSTEQPCFWVVWRMEEEPAFGEDCIAIPQTVTLSYHDAGRWLDAQETVEQVPVTPDVQAWLQAFVDEHHVQELKRRKRPESFKSLQDRFGNPARVSTEKNHRGGSGHG